MSRDAQIAAALAADPAYITSGRKLHDMAAIANRADAIMARAFPPHPRTPHGFYDPEGFALACQRSAARSRIRRALIGALPLIVTPPIVAADLPY